MRSSTKLIVVILLTITLIIITESQRTLASEEETKELEKLLNRINKPPIKSFQSKHGYILDCIDIHKQPAFDHPLLKNHSIQLNPTAIPKLTRDHNTYQNSSFMSFQPDEDISCPSGTVIIKRTTLEELREFQQLKSYGFKHLTSKDKNDDKTHHYAIAQYFGYNRGATGNINVWDPHVKSDQYSLGSIYVEGGSRDQIQIISAGWMVFPKLNKNHSSLFASWSSKGQTCYNTLCPGFVQLNTKFALGILAKPVSTYGGQQYYLHLTIFQDGLKGNWWLFLRNEVIGYWPKSLFNVDGLADGADRVYWGGEVFSAVRQKISPIMGSGHFPNEGFKKAAYINGIKVVDKVLKRVRTPPASSLALFADSPTCYKVEAKQGSGDQWSTAVFYGGPGGCTVT